VTRSGQATRSSCSLTATASSLRPRGLELDGSAFGLGTRSQRYAVILEDGVVRQLMIEPDPLAVTVSSVAAVLDAL
jgi:peroxiredoxin